MRAAIIKDVQELDGREIDLLLEDLSVQQEVIDGLINNEINLIDDLLEEYFYENLNWGISYNSGKAYVGLEYREKHREFIENLIEMTRSIRGNILADDESQKLIKRATTIMDVMDNECDDDDDYIWLKLDDKVYDLSSELIELLSNHFKNYLESLNFEKIKNDYDYVDLWLEDNKDEECIVDGDKVRLLV